MNITSILQYPFNFTVNKSLKYEALGRFLITLATTTGKLHITPFNYGDSPLGVMAIFLARRLAIPF